MRYENVVIGTFVERPNRFIAYVEVADKLERCHVKNTGRCKELLVPGAKVILEPATNPERATKYSIVGVYKNSILINMDSQAPNVAAYEWLLKEAFIRNITFARREVTYKNSRFDLFVKNSIGDIEQETFIEVKGVTLEFDGVAKFPDAPTQRGCKHIYELIDAVENGYRAVLLLVIQMKGIKYFTPNKDMDLALANAMKSASLAGVEIIAVDCRNELVDNIFSMDIDEFIQVKL